MPLRTASSAADKSLVERVFPGSSELARLCREKDWSATPLGPVDSWPASLQATASLIVTSPIGMIVLWGPELVQIYNDSYRAVMGEKHPAGLGQPNRECWPEVWGFNAPIFQGVIERCESFRFENQSLVIERHGYPEEACFTLSFSPVLDLSGEVGGVLATVVETTDAVARERAEEALRVSEQRYRLISRATNDVIWDWNWETGRVEWNEAVEVLFGCTPEQMGSTPDDWAARIHPDDRERVTAGLSAAVDGGSQHWIEEYRFRKGDGSYATVLDRGYIARTASGRCCRMIGAMLDLTERRRLDERLRQVAERDAYHLALADALRPLADPAAVQNEAARVLGERLEASRVYYVEITDDGEYGVILSDYCDGVPSVVGKHRFDDFGPFLMAEIRAGRTVVVRDVAEDPRLAPGEREVSLKLAIAAYVLVPLIKGGRPVAVVAVHQAQPRQWTEAEVALIEETAERTWHANARARAEAALRESEARLGAVLDQLPVAAGLLGRDGRLVLSNAKMRALVPHTMPSRDPERRDRWRAVDADGNAIPPEDWPGARALRGEPLQGGLDFTLTSEDGRTLWLLVSAVPLRSAAGEVTGAIVVVQDITERKRTEQALRDGDRRKDEFLAMLAHELRNPLAAIQNTAHLLSKTADEPRSQRWVDILQRQTVKLNGLVDDLLDVSRITRGLVELRQERVDLADTVSSGLESVRGLLEGKGHDVRLARPHLPLHVVGDPVRLEQILVNLVTNAAKYTNPGGRIDVSLSRQDCEVLLRVRDNGIGMTDETLARVFDLFGQAERSLARSEGGLGIGLTIVKRLVELHGGSIEAKSAGLGHGSEFVVRLPLAVADPAYRPAPSRQAEASSGKRVLVVEDQPDIAETLALLLEESGHEVAVVHDGRLALARAEELAPDVVLLDLGLPRMDGFEVAQRLRANPRTRAAVLAALTGYGQLHDRERAEAAGFDAHFVKPVNIDALKEFIGAAEPSAGSAWSGAPAGLGASARSAGPSLSQG